MTNKPFSFVLHSGPVIFLGKRERKKKERKRRNKRNKGRNTGEKKAVVERRHRISLVRERLPLSLPPPPLLPLLSPRNSEFRIFPPSSSVNLHFSSPLLPTLDAIFLFKSPAMLYNTQYANIHIYIYMYNTGETWPAYILYARSLLFEILKGKWRREEGGRKRK